MDHGIDYTVGPRDWIDETVALVAVNVPVAVVVVAVDRGPDDLEFNMEMRFERLVSRYRVRRVQRPDGDLLNLYGLRWCSGYARVEFLG